MKKAMKILIVVALVAAVGIVISIKQQGQNSTSSPAEGANSNSVAAEENAVDNLKSSPEKESLPKLVDLGSKQCIPCKQMAPILEDLKRDYEGVFEVEFIDVWIKENADYVERLKRS